MANSFEKIDYNLRPAKAVERRMLVTAFQRLHVFGSVKSYRYIGMGSVYFADFSLFHSLCGFETMVSIEDQDDPLKQERFRFNVPSSAVSLEFGKCTDVLPKLPWDLRSVVWLDYDGSLESDVLRDTELVANKLVSGGLLCVSVNALLEDGSKRKRHEILADRIGSASHLPAHITAAGLIKPNETYQVYRDILTESVTRGMNARNAGRPASQKFRAEQIVFFRYRDGAPMLTLGWIIVDAGQNAQFLQCDFSSLDFFASGDQPFDILPPLLTPSEMRAVNRCDAKGTYEELSKLPFPPDQVARFERIRRYWPAQQAAFGA